jgi:hypothetical protein
MLAANGFVCLGAQTPQRPADWCFQSIRPGECRNQFVLEGLAAQRMAGTQFSPGGSRQQAPDAPAFVGGDIGVLHHTGGATAYGGTFQGTFTAQGTRFALKARRRQWLGARFTWDVAAGPLIAQEESTQPNSGVQQGLGVSAETAISYATLAGIVANVDAMQVEGRTAIGLHVGARVESWGGVVAVAGTAIAAAPWIRIWFGGS